MKIKMVNGERRVPDFFMVGAAKSATTSLYAYLDQHPEIFLPERKELYYFAFGGETPRFKMADGSMRVPVGVSQEEYLKFYEKCPEGWIAGDTSSWYLYYHENVIGNIKKMYGDRAREVKIIMVLRNPVERAWSHYCMHLGQGTMELPFGEAISEGAPGKRLEEGFYPGYDYIGFGMYSRQVQAYLDAFEHVKILLHDDISRDSGKAVAEIFEFLGLEPPGQLDTEKRFNVSGAPKSRLAAVVGKLVYRPYFFKRLFVRLIPEKLRYKIKTGIGGFIFKKKSLSPGDRAILVDIYREDIEKLEKIINRDLSPWVQD